VLLTQELLPAIRSIAGDVFVFQQDNAPAHRARDTVELLRRETPQFISPDMWPSNSRDLTPVDYCICRDRSVHTKYQPAIRTNYGSGLLRHGMNFSTAKWTVRLISGENRLKACIYADGSHFEHCLPDEVAT